VKSENRVRVDLNTSGVGDAGSSLSLVLLDSRTVASGPALLIKIFEAAQLNVAVRSTNTVTVVSADDSSGVAGSNGGAGLACVVESNVSLDLDMELPSWVPFPVAVLERRGSKAFQGMLDKDCGRLVERFRNEYLVWSQEQATQAQ
jgi:hypothetical protein